MAREKYVIGNWKMNQTQEEIESFFQELGSLGEKFKCQSWICPQFIHLPKVKELGAKVNVLAGAQNCSHKTSGAFTGDISPTALTDLGISFTLIGHSERRSIFQEPHELLNEKVQCALDSGLKVVFCIGETLEEREAGQTEAVIKEQMEKGLVNISKEQLKNVIVAYEPVWAIGTGKTASPQQAQDAHAYIRNEIATSVNLDPQSLIILYGGSVKPGNVDELLKQDDIDGGLVGGASLKASDYIALCKAASSL